MIWDIVYRLTITLFVVIKFQLWCGENTSAFLRLFLTSGICSPTPRPGTSFWLTSSITWWKMVVMSSPLKQNSWGLCYYLTTGAEIKIQKSVNCMVTFMSSDLANIFGCLKEHSSSFYIYLRQPSFSCRHTDWMNQVPDIVFLYDGWPRRLAWATRTSVSRG